MSAASQGGKSVAQGRRQTHNDVVAEGVLDERQAVVGNLGDKLDALRVGGVVDAPLKDAAAVPVGGDLDAVGGDGVVDELRSGRRMSKVSSSVTAFHQ